MAYQSSSIKSKWKKTKWLLEESYFHRYVPRTLLFNKTNLNTMLRDHTSVFFKPTDGSGGHNIVRIRKKGGGYQKQLNTKKTFYSGAEALYRDLNRFAGKRSYLLQQGIRLAKSNGKPFDIRIMVQRNTRGKWVGTAVFTKIGSPGKVATNYNQGGSIGTFRQTMRGAGFHEDSITQIDSELKRIGVATGRNFDRHLTGFKELGLDVGLDSSGRPWILEVNTRPQVYPLKTLKDKRLYNRVISYAKLYGRYK